METFSKKAQSKFEQKINKERKQEVKEFKNINSKSKESEIVNNIKKIIPSNIGINVINKNKNEYTINVDSLLSNKVLEDLMMFERKNLSISIGRNLSNKKCKLKLWDNSKEKKL